ncbi:MAG: glutamine amidotransferase [Rhodospirillaceae bacterium]|nr:MAG: glutamine amidotransferase [Rhodospirillaceae bacterium]
MNTVVIIDYGSGNLRSAAKAFTHVMAESGKSGTVRVSARPEEVRAADRIVLPGVGAFGDCWQGLATVPGLMEALTEAVIRQGRPFLGICVGMQLMASIGREHGEHAGLDWIRGEVVPIDAPTLKVPHMGWNELEPVYPHPLLTGLSEHLHAYFVHSYHFVTADPGHRLATVTYGTPLAAMVGRDNLVGTQFHPEKSQALGLILIANFLRWSP